MKVVSRKNTKKKIVVSMTEGIITCIYFEQKKWKSSSSHNKWFGITISAFSYL